MTFTPATPDRLPAHLFQLAFALLMTHELDAVARHEWRVLPLTRFFSDEVGFIVFVAAHVPVIWLLTAQLWGPAARRREVLRALFCAFCVIHVGLHWLFRNDPAYEFQSMLSESLIWGAGAAGAAFLVAAWRRGRGRT